MQNDFLKELEKSIDIFYSPHPIAAKIRNDAIDAWKKKLIAEGKRTKEELQDPNIVAIIADLEDATDIQCAIMMNDLLGYPSNSEE